MVFKNRNMVKMVEPVLKCKYRHLWTQIAVHIHEWKYKNMHREGHKGGFSLTCYLLFLEKKKKKTRSKDVKILELTK